jgi:predicted Zn finger-like uncharacterized protein
MDVQCEHCKTEYEFDDALVSGRGTTVRCTNCGHQFKVRRADAGESSNDQWLVQTGTGAQLTFLSLRELQRAILAKQVGRGDLLRRGGGPARALGTIAELDPFFEGRASNRPPPPQGPSGSATSRIPGAPGIPGDAPAFPKRTASWTSPDRTPAPPPPAARRKIDTLRPTGAGAAVPPPPPLSAMDTLPVAMVVQRVPAPSPPPASVQDPVTMRRPPPTPPPPPAASPVYETSSPLPPPTRQERDYVPAEPMRNWQPSSEDMDAPLLPRRRRVGGWIVAFVLFLAVGVMGWVVAKPYLAGRAAGAAAPMDPRAQSFVMEGERALTDNNLDLAQEDFDKASALAERDPRVLLDEARVAAVKTDVPWLKLRLLPADAAEDTRATKAQLADRVGKVRKAADDAVAAAPDDPAALRAKIDALRLAGERDAARSSVSKVIGQASQPETAYVLAALDLAEPEPLWNTVIDRLRLAAGGEGSAGRARAALVYALARSGDAAGARAELAKLDAFARPYPLSPNLHAFVDKAPGKLSLDGGVAANVPHVEVSALPIQPLAPAGGGGGGGGGEAPVAGDSPTSMVAASQAIKKGDWGRARQIYEAIATRNPSDSEALAGIGDCDRAQGNAAGAIAAYKRALSVNPSYLPALLGVADTQWASGDRGSAQRAYKDIEDRFPDGTYPSYVKARTEQAAPAPTPTTAPSAAGTSTATAQPTSTAPATTATAKPDPDGL